MIRTYFNLTVLVVLLLLTLPVWAAPGGVQGRELVEKRRVVRADEFIHGVALSQILGPFAVNTVFFVGYRLHRVGGLLSACAFMTPSLFVVLVLSWL